MTLVTCVPAAPVRNRQRGETSGAGKAPLGAFGLDAYRIMDKEKMTREFSSGAVVLRHMKSQWWVAVIEPGRSGEPEDRKNTIALPKGNIDSGEKPLETAVREVREETGLTVRPVTKLGDIKYVYVRRWSDGAKVFKIVSFFLVRYVSGHIGDIKATMQHEVRRAYWLPLAKAADGLSYSGEKQMARKALEYLSAHEKETKSTF
ncbi:MAG TPA: NUDIX domain-containing protein [Terriglobales bacterium]